MNAEKKAVKKQPSALSHLKGPEGPRLRFILDAGTLSGDWLLVWRRARNRKNHVRLYLFLFPGETVKSALDIKVSAVSLMRLGVIILPSFHRGNQDGFFRGRTAVFPLLVRQIRMQIYGNFSTCKLFSAVFSKKTPLPQFYFTKRRFCILPRLQNSGSTLDIFLIFQHIICKTSKFSEHLAKFCFRTPAEKKVTFQKNFFSPAMEIAASRWFPHS